MAAPSTADGAPLAPKDLPSDMPPRSPGSNSSEDSPKRAGSGNPLELVGQAADTTQEAPHGTNGVSQLLLPLSPVHFSASSRAMLREGIGGLGANMAELQAAVWAPGAPREGNICDFQMSSELVANPDALETLYGTRRPSDWSAAGLLLHYERLLWGASASGAVPAGSTEEAWGDPLRLDVRRTGAALNKAVKAFAQAELRERRESQHMGPRPMPRMPAAPGDFDGSTSDPPPPAPNSGAAAAGDDNPSPAAPPKASSTTTPQPSTAASAEALPPGVTGAGGV